MVIRENCKYAIKRHQGLNERFTTLAFRKVMVKVWNKVYFLNLIGDCIPLFYGQGGSSNKRCSFKYIFESVPLTNKYSITGSVYYY